jgi:uncharacterized protein YcfJ
MKRLLATSLALCLAATTGLASAQTYNGSGNDYQQPGVRYDYARVLRVDPVFDSTYASNHATSGQRCYERRQYAGGGYADPYNGGYNEPYNGGYNNGSYSNGSYNNGGYNDRYNGGSDGYYDQYGNYRRSGGTQAGATMATVIGGIVGAAIGSQVGGGSARYATSAIGTMVGGMAGRSIYEQRQRQRVPERVGTVTVCDPVPVNSRDGYRSDERAVNAYDVTYEYGGQQYTSRTSYHPGDRIRVRVDVQAE